MGSRTVRSVIARIGLLCLFAGSPRSGEAQVWDSIPPDERAQAIHAALVTRFDRVPDGTYINACGLYLMLGQDPWFRKHLLPGLRERVTGEVTDECQWQPRARYGAEGLYLWSMYHEAPGRLVILAVKGGTSPHHEEYTLTRDRKPDQTWGPWHVEDIRLYTFSFD